MKLNLRAIAAIASGLIILGLLGALYFANQTIGDQRRAISARDVEIGALRSTIHGYEDQARVRSEAAARERVEAQRINRSQQSLIEALRRSVATPRGEGPCTISPALRAAQGAL